MSGLTEEQRQKIEENKRRALAKRAKKFGASPQNKSSFPPSSASSFSCQSGTSKFTSNQTNNFDKRIADSRLKILEQRHVKPYSSADGRLKVLGQSHVKPYSSAQGPPSTILRNGIHGNIVHRTDIKGSVSNKSNHSSGFNSSAAISNLAHSSTNTHLATVPQTFYGQVQQLRGKVVLISNDTFMIDVAFHTAVIEFFKTRKTRSYDAAKKSWSFKLEEYDCIMKGLEQFRPDVLIEGLPRYILDIFRPNTKDHVDVPEADLSRVSPSLVATLKQFQRDGVNLMIHRKGRLLLADDMGLGKTLQALCVAAYYQDEWPLLIVSPSSVRFDWAQQICKWLPDICREEVNVVVSSKENATCGIINIISYDLMAKKVAELKQKKFKVIIMDESHFLKNTKTSRTKAAMPLLKNAKRVLLLSGTPALSRPIELFCQINAVCPGLMKFHDFGLRYCAAKQTPWGWDYNGSSNMLELQLVLEKCIMLRRQKKEVLSQLPPKTRQMVVLDPGSIKHHKDLKKAYKIMDKNKHKGVEDRGVLLMYFRETCRAKLAAVREYVLDLLESDKKLLVFGHHREMLDAVEDCVNSQTNAIKYIRIDGTTSSEQRSIFCEKFQMDEDYKLAILSITAANAGLNLSAANMVVFAELFWNPGILVQAEDRAHRMGQKDSVSVQYLVAQKTADDMIWPLIQEKLDVLGKAGLTKDDFSDADTKIMVDPTQTSLLDLFTTDYQYSEMCAQSTDVHNGHSSVYPETDSYYAKSKTQSKTTPTKRQVSITSFISSTSPKKQRVEEERSACKSIDVICEDEDDDIAFSNDDLAAIASFDWDDGM